MAHGLETDAETLAEQVDVVMQRFGRLQKLAIRQHQRTRKIVRQADARQTLCGGVGVERWHGDKPVDGVTGFDQRQLRAQLKCLLAGLKHLGQV